ncbi:hypothetical protein Tco_1065639 [Tanacetum coccineum]
MEQLCHLTYWSARLVDYSSSSDSNPSKDSLFVAPSSEFLLAPVVAPPGFHRWPTILVRPDEAIPFGRPYHIHPNGPPAFTTLIVNKEFVPPLDMCSIIL